ncbi:MAG TPA: hypothetical protein VD999_00845 [Vitreimonas sp.]|nr:hypothetical protein [Vitreimonas sp.]
MRRPFDAYRGHHQIIGDYLIELVTNPELAGLRIFDLHGVNIDSDSLRMRMQLDLKPGAARPDEVLEMLTHFFDGEKNLNAELIMPITIASFELLKMHDKLIIQ